MSTKQIGMNTIGTLEFPSILAGDFPRVTAEGVAGATDIALGSVVKTDGSVLSLVTAPTDEIYGVAGEEITAGSVGTVWLTGEYIGPRLVFGGDEEWTAYVNSARTKSIFIKDARLAPNQ